MLLSLEAMFFLTANFPKELLPLPGFEPVNTDKTADNWDWITVEPAHVHGDGGDESEAFVELPLEQLTEHVETDQLMVVQDGSLG